MFLTKCHGLKMYRVLGGGQWSASHPTILLMGKEPPVPIEWEAGWAPELVWTQWWQREKNPCPCWEWNPSHPAYSLATTVTELPQPVQETNG
jgi:hypothetical protein